METNPFHEGESAVQRAAGEEDVARQNAPLIADAVTGGAAAFLPAQRMLVVASRDGGGRLWASVLFGAGGFVTARDGGRRVEIDRSAVYSDGTLLLGSHLRVGAPLGLLAIDLSSRRRLRVNGVVDSLTEARLGLRVEQAYPNCPKYIQRRRLGVLAPGPSATHLPVRNGESPDRALLAAVEAADTAFVASGHPSRGLDASHRGGGTGFIRVLRPDVLRVPDYEGNGMFNTLGNLAVDARCGLTVLDFRSGRLHQMTGEAAVHFGSRGAHDDPALTGRSWDFRVHAWQSAELPVRAQWEFVDSSPYNPP